MAPAGDSLAEPITVAGLRAEVLDEKRASISAEKRASIATDPRPATADAGAVTPAGGVTPDGQFPTAEELDTLRRVPNKIPMKLFSIAFIELCERFSYYGCTVVFILTHQVTNFIQQKLPEGSTTGADPEQPGALGMGQRASTGITTFNQFWQYFMPLLGAYIADQYWGRYKTISWALGIDIIGHIILIMSAIPPVIGNQGGALGAMIIAIIVIGFGTGGFKPNVNPLIVEQLGEQYMHVKTLKSGERVIVDPAVTIERVYLWFYFCINVGALVGQVTMVFAEKEVGFWLSYTLPTFMLCLCPLVMWLNRHKYERRPPGGSVLGQALKTWFLAQKGCWSINPVATWKNLHKDDFWEKVKPSNFSHETRPKWMTFDDAWVDELSRGFNACAVFCWYPIFWLCYNQINNNLISQAAVMQRHGVPNDILSNLNPFALLIFIPLNDFFIYPALRKAGFRFTPIKKITAGFFTGAAAMIWAAVVQHYIYQKSECAVEINVWAQTGSYVLIALSEVFASITSLEYAFSKAPKNMRSMVQAVALFMTAFSAALGQALVGLAADPLLVWNYGVVAILAVIAGTCFYVQFRDLDVHEDDLNALPEGHAGATADEEAPLGTKEAN
ncbi:POT family-domain-containing protein [Fusarium oxysporum Fo47]|uniref:POT family-domain-containing protein n=1 Tax=Fusarium oxysporum Fo47 TaxID=660027 RepID=UPI002869A394|nr:POT family-domain-containing protein [Fusarium oxysporum Fo47]QKD51601.2 POT family-domain-containing protein [Fusarium oxysporum Fo47]